MKDTLKTYKVGKLTVQKRRVDWNRLEETTALEVNDLYTKGKTGYANPEYTLLLDKDIPYTEIVRKAKTFQLLWIKRLRKQLGYRAVKHYVRDQTHINRQLLYTGVLVVNGEIKLSSADWGSP